MSSQSVLIQCLFSLVMAGSAAAQTSYPMLMSLSPVAAQVGQTSEHKIKSRYSMYGAYQLLVTGEGVTGEIVHPEKKESDKEKKPNLQEMTVRFTVAPDALPGVRDFRIATPNGASTIGQLVIVREKVISEDVKKSSVSEGQQVEVPATICGAIEKAEDVDFYRFKAEAGDALSFHVRAMRLQDRIHDLQKHCDPILTLRNAAGVTLAASDNYFYGDPFIGYSFEHAGEYLLEIRDVRYQGNQYWQYSIEISDQPFVTNVYPLAVAPGEQAKLEMIGFQVPKDPMAQLNVPMDCSIGPNWSPLKAGEKISTNPAPLVVSDLHLVRESDTDNNTPETAQAIANPIGINGRIGETGDIDCFAFEAKKGQKFTVEVIARRQQSSLDPHLRILNEQGKQLQLNDDMRIGKRNFADSLIENWTAPGDGKYVIEIRDLHLRGGSPFVYFIRLTHAEPYFELYADTDKTQLTPGTSGVIFVRAVRKNSFDGEIQLHIDGLPKGVTAQCGRILAGKGQDGCISLVTAADAAMSVSNITIRGTASMKKDEGPAKELSAVARIYQETYQPGGGRGHWPVTMHTVSIGEPIDIRGVKLSTHDITLKPGESKKIEVTIERAEGFDKNVTLDVLYKHLNSVYGNSLPEGVTLDGTSKTLLTAGTTQGHITLKASDKAPPAERQQIAVMANVSINFVMKSTYASEPVFVSVLPSE